MNGHQLHKASEAEDTNGSLAQGPKNAVISALRYHGWKMEQARILINEDEWGMDFTIGSPTMLKYYLVMAHDQRTYKGLEQQLRDKGD